MTEGENKDYYQLLGVDRDAPTEKIKEVYRDIARVYHPDSNFYDEIAPTDLSPQQESLFKVITAAYQTLIDEKKRAEYDLSLDPLRTMKIRTWDEEEGGDNRSPRHHQPTTDSSVPAYGQFGRVEGDTQGWGNSEGDTPMSISQIMKRSTKPAWHSKQVIIGGAVLLVTILIGIVALVIR
ncbi:MAG: hypothetical protein DCC75_02150 [Proteobacteria bacterium]|nr:MAG: hypothetical protein DCC75_02150 [Pseudomonadota bacterium]